MTPRLIKFSPFFFPLVLNAQSIAKDNIRAVFSSYLVIFPATLSPICQSGSQIMKYTYHNVQYHIQFLLSLYIYIYIFQYRRILENIF